MQVLIYRAIAIVTIATSVFTAESVAAQSILKCIDRDGQIAFQDKPCATGQREQPVAIASAPPSAPPPEYSKPDRGENSRQPRAKAAARQAIVYSFECRTENGVLFYRHEHCPGSIDRSGLIGGRRSASREKVRGRRISRLEACRGMRSVARDGHEFDDTPSTYDRNLGRDPCRRY